MDEQELNNFLSRIQAPEPDKNAENQALHHAMAAFEEKMQKASESAQGNSKSNRLNNTNNPFEMLRRLMMKNKMMWSGLAGGVAVVALVGVVGMPFLEQQLNQRASSKDRNITSSSTSFSDTGFGGQAPGPTEFPPAYEEAVRQESEQRASEAAQIGGSSIPAPIARPSERMEIQRGKKENLAKAAPAIMGQSADVDMAAPAAPSVSLNSLAIAPPADIVQPSYHDEGRDKFENVEENTVKSVIAEPVSTFSIDVDTASYAFIRRQLNNGVLPQKDAVRIEEMINYFDYAYALPEKDTDPFKPNITVYDAPWHPGHKIIHVGIKAFDIETKPQSNLVFLIDTSGSMNEPDKLPLLKNSFKMMLDALSPQDTVGIVVYAGSAGTVLEPTKIGDKQKIIQAIDNLESGGATAGAEGIRQAYALAEAAKIKDGNNRIILASDGDFNVGITDPNELQGFVERKRHEGIFLSVLGFDQGNYNDQMMQKLAQNGNGNAAYIDNLNEARKVLVQEAGSTLFTVAKDVKIQVEFNPARVSEYRLIGYETRRLNREDFNNDTVDAGEVGAGHAVTALYEITPMGAEQVVDNMRYVQKPVEMPKVADPDGTGEYAFLKIRYKKPDSDTSILMTRPITHDDEAGFDNASDDVRFAAAVAEFGQLLKNSKYAGNMTYDQVIDM
ncbi:MAG: arginine biosynthesis bifunctional glutamate N-acetyltransferase/amino-acid acetyltransferase, partial [Alphaproteobacteria bacterium]|nr:arginine biosynthesis bifunctional glutamate N-acetyltransferase/amino-acid acetyltransferase [Alphaproteobacteria bacterium]